MKNTDTKFTIFSKKNLGNVRTLLKGDGTVLFVGKDVCDILGIANARDAYSRLLEDEKVDISGANLNVCSTDVQKSHGGARRAKLVSESGLYMLVMGSRKPEAEAFQRWVTREILPSIRKNGGYIMGQENLPAESRKALEKKILKLSKEVQAQSECADTFEKYYEDILDLYKKLKDENTTLSQDLQDALTRLDENDMVVGTGATGISTELNYFYDNFGNKYTTAEDAVVAIKAARE